MTSRNINNNLENSNNKLVYSEKDLVKLLKLSKMLSTKEEVTPPPPIQQYAPVTQPMMPQQPMYGYGGQMYQTSELTRDERDEIRRMIYKSNEELEANLKDFIRSNEKKFLEYLKELIQYKETVKKAEEIQEDEKQKEIAESQPQSSNQIIDTMKNIPSSIGGLFSNVTKTIGDVVNTANSVITGKNSKPPNKPPSIDEVDQTNTPPKSTEGNNNRIDTLLKSEQQTSQTNNNGENTGNNNVENNNTGNNNVGNNNTGNNNVENNNVGNNNTENNDNEYLNINNNNNSQPQQYNQANKKQTTEAQRLAIANKKANQEIRRLKQEVANMNILPSITGNSKKNNRRQTGGKNSFNKRNKKTKTKTKRKVRNNILS